MDDVAMVLNMLDVFVLPSKIRESFGMVLVEAMACGIPVIGSNIGGIPEIIKDSFNGYLFEPGNEKDLTDKLSKILSDEKLRKQLSANALKTVENRFTVEKMIEEIEEALTK